MARPAGLRRVKESPKRLDRPWVIGILSPPSQRCLPSRPWVDVTPKGLPKGCRRACKGPWREVVPSRRGYRCWPSLTSEQLGTPRGCGPGRPSFTRLANSGNPWALVSQPTSIGHPCDANKWSFPEGPPSVDPSVGPVHAGRRVCSAGSGVRESPTGLATCRRRASGSVSLRRDRLGAPVARRASGLGATDRGNGGVRPTDRTVARQPSVEAFAFESTRSRATNNN